VTEENHTLTVEHCTVTIQNHIVTVEDFSVTVEHCTVTVQNCTMTTEYYTVTVVYHTVTTENLTVNILYSRAPHYSMAVVQGAEVVVSPSDPGRARITFTPELHGLRDLVSLRSIMVNIKPARWVHTAQK
jgi:hypothetical protein